MRAWAVPSSTWSLLWRDPPPLLPVTCADTLMLDEKVVPDITSKQSNAHKCEKWVYRCADGITRSVAFGAWERASLGPDTRHPLVAIAYMLDLP